MKLGISSLFLESDYYFKISYKVDQLIEKKLNSLFVSYSLDLTKPEYTISLIVSTSSETYETKVKGPDFNKKYKMINWGLWLPLNKKHNSSEQLVFYLKNLFDAVVIVLKQYGINENDIRNIQTDIESEVIDNPIYYFSEEEPLM